jgi:H+/Cl- antiporter ClcA
VSALWYSTLLFCLVSVVLSFYLSILLSNFAINTNGSKLLLRVLHKTADPKKSRWESLFALQVPLMLLSYALIGYVLGLSLMVVRPLWKEPWGNSSLVRVLIAEDVAKREELTLEFQIAIVYCVFLGLALLGGVSVGHFIYVKNEEVLKFD